MIKYQVLENVMKKNIPSYDKLSEYKRKAILRDFLNKNLEKILLKIKLPDPLKIKMDIIREKYLDERRPKGHKKGNWKINYNLWRLLFEAKSKIKFGTLQDSLFEPESVNSWTTTIISNPSFSNTSLWSEPRVEPSTSLKEISTSVIHFKVETKLEKKLLDSEPHRELIKCLDNTCRTTGLEIKNAEFYLHETVDIENPNWKKIVLDIKFDEDDFDTKIEKWERIRVKIDNSISKLKYARPELLEIAQLEKKLFINMIF